MTHADNDTRTKTAARILILDDMPWMLKKYRSELEAAGFEVVSLLACDAGEKPDARMLEGTNGYVCSITELGEFLKVYKPDAVLTDYSMPTFKGDEVVRAVKAWCPSLPAVIHTSEMDMPLPDEIKDHSAATQIQHAGLEAGANAILAKNNDFGGSGKLRIDTLCGALGMRMAPRQARRDWVDVVKTPASTEATMVR